MLGSQQKRRILFVDDEPLILGGLKRMLYNMRQEWDLFFALGPTEALNLLNDHYFDVVISDMRMPEMDGAELLTFVREKYPKTVRFILSGFSDKDMIMRTVDSTDQFLNKPCNAEELIGAIKQALNITKIVPADQIDQFILNAGNLATLPGTYTRLEDVLRSSSSSVGDVASIVSSDVPITAKVLQLVNSAFFGLRQHVKNIDHAVSLLGYETIKGLVLTNHVFDKFSNDLIDRFQIQSIYDHCIAVGMASKQIVHLITGDQALAERSVMAGMLHDIGKLLLIKNIPDDYESTYRLYQQQQLNNPIQIEKQYIGVDHTEVGACLLGKWGLPNDIVHAVQYHHIPDSSQYGFNIASAVYTADVINRLNECNKLSDWSTYFDKRFLERSQIDEKMPNIIEQFMDIHSQLSDKEIS